MSFFTTNFQKYVNAVLNNPFNNNNTSGPEASVTTGVLDQDGNAIKMFFMNKKYLSEYGYNSQGYNNSEPVWGLNMDISRGYSIKFYNETPEGLDTNDYVINGEPEATFTPTTATIQYNNDSVKIVLNFNIIPEIYLHGTVIGIYKKVGTEVSAFLDPSKYKDILVGVITEPVLLEIGQNYSLTINLEGVINE